MAEKRQLPVVGAGGGVGRREVLQGLFAGVGAGLALPDPAHAEAMAPVVAAAQAAAKAPNWKPVFLDPHQFATVTALCARIVPGSDKALADRFIDSLLGVAEADRRQRFLTALGAIEGASLSRFQKPFRALSEAQQVEVLEAASAGEPGRKDWVWTPGTLIQPPERGPEVVTLRDHFDHVKGWIVDSYYSSEAGLRELGYTGQTFFASFPDCPHDDHS